MSSSVKEIVALWPSVEAMASDIGASRWAIRKWCWRGRIPGEWLPLILRSEVARKADLTADQLITVTARRPAPVVAAE